MWTFVALTAVLAPQDPAAGAKLAEAIQAIHAEQEVDKVVEKSRAQFASLSEGKIKGVTSPSYASRLRGAGVGAVDFVREHLTVSPDTTPNELLELVAGMWTKRVRPVKSKRLDLRGFEKVCERVHRDVVGAIGSGRDIETTAARLIAVLDRVRPRGIAVGLTGDKAGLELVTERFQRVARADRTELLGLARRLLAASLQLGDPKLVKKLRKAELGPPRSIEGVRGQVIHDRETSFGRFVVGGPGKNEYDCSQIDVIIDVGGDDVYRGPAGGAGELRRLAVVVDLEGSDRYQSLNDGLGSGTFGIGLCLDMAGDDVYRAGDRSMGFGASGVGVFLDLGGKDDVEIGSLGGGVGMAGIGICADFDGDDKQVGGSESFGCGLPGGLGVFVDLSGSDIRSLGSDAVAVRGKAEPTSCGFGAGVGLLPQLSGGVGVCLDLAGNDKYTASGLSVGSAWQGGCGVFRDMAGNDTYQVTFASLGASSMSGFGLAIDDAGGDSYSGAELCLGSALQSGSGWFFDVLGDDKYAAGAASFGTARRGAIAGFIDRVGTDTYQQAEGDLVWPSANQRAVDAIGVFLDEGGANGAFRGEGEAVDGSVRMVETDRPGGLERRILVDR